MIDTEMKNWTANCKVARIICQFCYDHDREQKFVISFKNWSSMERWFNQPQNHVFRVLQMKSVYVYDDDDEQTRLRLFK